jgi:toxin ParE1/3/4
MAAVVWMPAAYEDLESVRRYIARDSPRNGEMLASRITQAARRLELFPRYGRVVPEFARDDLRELIVESFRVVYLVSADLVQILAVRHGARRLTDLLDV